MVPMEEILSLYETIANTNTVFFTEEHVKNKDGGWDGERADKILSAFSSLTGALREKNLLRVQNLPSYLVSDREY
jgi:hypothetical protein